MSKPKEGRENEYFKGIIRQQRAEIIRLKRKIRDLEKQTMLTEYESEELIEDLEEQKDCPKCGQGNFRAFEINNRSFLVCERCKYRVKV